LSFSYEDAFSIIGAGPGGYAAAFHAADMGMKVTLVDADPNPGGVCTFQQWSISATFSLALNDAIRLKP
jgi:thioredoxin reductase